MPESARCDSARSLGRPLLVLLLLPLGGNLFVVEIAKRFRRRVHDERISLTRCQRDVVQRDDAREFSYVTRKGAEVMIITGDAYRDRPLGIELPHRLLG